jgi:hypothetical protein
MATLAEALEQWNSDTIKSYVQLLGYPKPPTRKADRIQAICAQMLNPDKLQQVWNQLDPLAQKAVSAAYHNDGQFNEDAFVAQYGSLPPRPKKEGWSYHSKLPILLDLFILDKTIPADLKPLLANLVAPVERFQLTGVEKPPATFAAKYWREEYPIICVETEIIGRADLLTYLQMVEQGILTWSEKNRDLTAASIRKLYTNLMAGDFYPEPEKLTTRYTIRPFGLDTFAQNAGLVTSTGKLTSAGRKYLQTQDPDLLLEAFEQWAEKGKFDELTRITQLHGLNARGTRLTPPASRREKVIEALSWCPAQTWISILDFYRAVKIWHFDFEVELTDWSNLYAGSYKEYGYMDGNDYWLITKGLFINAILMEYLATIGAVDIAYIMEDLPTLDIDGSYADEAYSLHDGLLYFRINHWGAFLLGQASEYVPTQPRKRDLFTLDDQLQLHLLAELRPNEQLQLEAVAEQVKEGVYRLDNHKLLSAVEGGQKLDHLAQFLENNGRGSLPQPVADWLARLRRNMKTIQVKEEAVVVEVQGAEQLAVIESDAVLAKLCQPLPATKHANVLVLAKNLSKFQKRLKELGYLVG